MTRVLAPLDEPVWDPEAHDPLPVARPCTTDAGYWVCSTHRHVARHNLDASSHEAGPGRHVIYWRCHQHGPETALSD